MTRVLGQRKRTHTDTIKVRVPAIAMGVRFMTVVDVCRNCHAVGDALSQYRCYKTEETHEEWMERVGAEEYT